MLRRLQSGAEGWAIQARVISALMLRDIVVRYGRANIGFAWVILEPMLLCSGVMILWSAMGGHAQAGLNLIEFLLTGYMLLTMWRHMTNSMLGLGRHSAFLLYHRQISLFDVVWARLVLEFAATTTALLIIWGTLYAVGLVHGAYRLDLCILGWFMMAWLAAGFGMIFVGVSERSEVFEKLVAPAQYLIIPISGFIIMVDWVPDWAQKYMMLNPMVHCYEVLRAGYFGPSVTTHYSLPYFACCSLVLTFWGVRFVERARHSLRLN
jgi:capsular polysaccharide transport system permease protein